MNEHDPHDVAALIVILRDHPEALPEPPCNQQGCGRIEQGREPAGQHQETVRIGEPGKHRVRNTLPSVCRQAQGCTHGKWCDSQRKQR